MGSQNEIEVFKDQIEMVQKEKRWYKRKQRQYKRKQRWYKRKQRWYKLINQRHSAESRHCYFYQSMQNGWFGKFRHIQHNMEDSRMPNRKVYSMRRRRRPTQRQINYVTLDLQTMLWRSVVEDSKAHTGLQCRLLR